MPEHADAYVGTFVGAPVLAAQVAVEAPELVEPASVAVRLSIPIAVTVTGKSLIWVTMTSVGSMIVAVSSTVTTEVMVLTLVKNWERSSSSVTVTVTTEGVAVTVCVVVEVLQARLVTRLVFMGKVLTHRAQGVTVFCKNEEQSAVAEEGNGDADVALTARRQLSALQPRLHGFPAARAANEDETKKKAERMVRE